MHLFRFPALLVLASCFLGMPATHAQSGDPYDASWYKPNAPYVQIDVTADGVYRIDAATLKSALPDGTALSDIPPETIRLLDKGREIPIQLSGTADGQLDNGDTMTFVGQRNRGTDELWAYNWDESAQSSTYHSLYSDTTTYWMTWGGANGRRYANQPSATGGSASQSALRDTVHAEKDGRYYFGRPRENGKALYTESEGYFWEQVSLNGVGSEEFEASPTLPVGRRTNTGTMELTIRLDGATRSCHRVDIEGNLNGSFKVLTTVPDSEDPNDVWRNYTRRTVTVPIDQSRVPSSGLEVKLTSHNENFADSCPNPATTPNHVLLDWIEATYTRTLEARNDRQRFVVETTAEETYELRGHSGSTVHVYNPNDARRFEAPISSGTATFTDAPRSTPTPYWAVGANGFRTPAAVRADQPSNWSASSNEADYLILTTEALLPSARRLANYRASEAGGNHQVEVALVQNVFDEFDYGRPTPIAIRRFVRASQNWTNAPDFLTIFGDAQYPIDDGSVDTLFPKWSVPSFGYSPSDGWFAMQNEGRDDWSEVLAVGRIPVRSVAQGNLFIEKLKTYEGAPLQRWQKRMLLLAGGTSDFEQSRLQGFSNFWGEIASDTVSSNASYTGSVSTGMDTLRYYKQSTSSLDASFQDSLAVDLKRGAGWLNYFGHSAAQTWEIVTDPPSEFDNAGKLPVVVSLACRTGSFAGGRFEQKSAPSLGEQLVVGSTRPDGTPKAGALNGGIAHFGESSLGTIGPSADLNDALVERVFVDTARVLGEAIRSAKAEVDSTKRYVKPLLQYGLLGDPATQLALPDQPDLHVEQSLVSISPIAPTPSEHLTVSVDVQSRGLIPSDSVTVQVAWNRPDGRTTRRTRRVERFPRTKTVEFAFSPSIQDIGTNSFRVTVDPENEYAEEDEGDNTTLKEKTIFGTGLSLVSPADLSTVSSQRPSLTFSISRDAEEPTPVVIQLDSVPTFSSSFRQETQQIVDDFVGSWKPSSLSPNTTYYWRIRPAENEQNWKQARFTVAPDLDDGSWLQEGRLFSVNGNERLSRSDRSWQFASFERIVSTMSERGSGSRPNGFVINGTSKYEYLKFGFGILVMNGSSGEVRESASFPTYDLRDRFEGDVGDQQEAIDSLSTFLDEVPQEGDYVFVRTRHLARESGSSIPQEVANLFENLGTTSVPAPYSQAIDTLSYDHVWLMSTRKGHPEETVEQVSPPSESGDVKELIQETSLSFPYASGQTLTPKIGPASQWKTLSWRTDAEPNDEVRIDVLSADSTLLIEDVSSSKTQAALDQIDATTHPYLRLRATLTDSETRTVPQLERWSVSYRGVPELVVDGAGLRSLGDSLRQGEPGPVSLPVANLGPVPSDSVQVQYTVTDAENVTETLSPDILPPLAPGTRDTSSINIATASRPGTNVLTATARTNDTPERVESNNTVNRSFFVQRDQTPPSLEVFANDRTLFSTSPETNRNDDRLPFVSPQSSFEIVLKDNNPNLPLDDTTHIDVFLKGGTPDTLVSVISEFQRIPFAGSALDTVQSDAKNILRVRFTPSLPSTDSTYTLKVEGRDVQNNELTPFKGSFRTKKNQVIGDVYPYPNPMNTHTTFAFRVKGGTNKMLHDFGLRIYTLSGRLVRTFDAADLETPLGVGWNTLRWNGRDEDGDRVATGVYLYRVRVKGDDETFRGNVEKVTVIR